ncbi:hypothetical protein B484DRAFT_436287, partial [Ochromonadaceae sp. CCMP2298]
MHAGDVVDAAVFAAGVDAAGRQAVSLALGDHNVDLTDSVSAIQGRFSLGSSSSAGAIQFLLAMKSSHASISISIFEGLKSALDELIQAMDQASLEAMLDETIPFVELSDLQVIPMAIMKRMPHVSRRHLAYLVEKDVISECPLVVQRQAWKADPPFFLRCVDAALGRDQLDAGSHKPAEVAMLQARQID